MIFVVSAEGTEDVSFSSLRELEEEACHELDEVVAIHDELLDKVSADELGFAKSDELDSSTALLSVFSGPEPLESSPQATNIAANVKVKNASKGF